MATLQDPVNKLAEAIERMSPRERALAAALGAVTVLCVLLLFGFLIYSRLSDLEERNDAMRQALKDIERKRGAYLQARQKVNDLEQRIGQSPLQLSGFLETAAKEAGVEIRETNPRTPEAIGKKYTQRSVDLRLSKVALEPLAKFMRRLEQNAGNLVMVTQLSIRARDDKHVDFDVDMTVSTYERAAKKPPEPKGAGKAAVEDGP